jgi:hypothetical protein
MFLTGKIVEAPGAYPISQRLCGLMALAGSRLKQIHEIMLS